MKTDAIKIIQQVEQTSFTEGFKAGWYAAHQTMDKALKTPIMPICEDVQDADGIAVPKKGNPFREGTKSWDVYHYVSRNPGKTGVEIFRALDIKTKIGRTALYRMKDGGLAVNKDGWRLL